MLKIVHEADFDIIFKIMGEKSPIKMPIVIPYSYERQYLAIGPSIDIKHPSFQHEGMTNSIIVRVILLLMIGPG
jgi:hypothetical protein